jgi:hypothetical protein
MLLSDEMWDKAVQWLMGYSGQLGPFFVKVLLGIAGLWFLLKALEQVLDKLAKALDAYKNAGFPTTFDRKRRAEMEKRRGFCKVLAADLAFLAKKESWNDQYFADLEADVEVEGTYYPTAVHRFMRRRVSGLRRVPSLIDAIESSSEQTLLVIGEPGSGKSVALRHLATEMAERGRRSSSANAFVPLYVNLKELVAAVGAAVDADCIRTFVLDNIRRGDSDTASFVREHWDDYRDRGLWFFLFDSFDEIPSVLHAPSGSPVIAEYTEAVHSFVVGMGSCRSVLASREFKGPDKLPWHRLRILPLSEKRQQDLIQRSFLDDAGKDLAVTHVASAHSTLYENPMFLTLLCRHIKDTGGVPMNDLHLLSGHIRRLATREGDYIQRKYGVEADAMIAAATHLAVLFAERPELGLAPTRDEIARAVAERPDLRFDYEVMIPALVDVKIGRSDVEEARSGDRRFTFSHRRYQETLFVDYLIANPAHIAPRQFLTDTRWREYAVTLLQSQAMDRMRPLLQESESLLQALAARQSGIPVADVAALTFHAWSTDETHLLQLLQEGLGRRPDQVPASLGTAVQALLEPRWENGDILDRTAVMQLGGLLPKELLTRYMLHSIDAGSYELKAAAFRQSVFLRQMPEELAAFVREQLAQETLGASGRTALLQIRALMQRLPESIGACHVVERCAFLRVLLLPARALYRVLLRIPSSTRLRASRGSAPHLRRMEMMVTGGSVVYMLIAAFVVTLAEGPRVGEMLGSPGGAASAALFLIVAAMAVVMVIKYRLRAAGHRLGFGSVLAAQAWPSMTRSDWAVVGGLIAVVVVTSLPGVVVSLLSRGSIDIVRAWVLSLAICGLVYSLASALQNTRRTGKQRRQLAAWRRDGMTGFALAMKAPSVDTLLAWIAHDRSWIGADSLATRALLRVALWRNEPSTYVSAGGEPDILTTPWTVPNLRHLYYLLVDDLDERAWIFHVPPPIPSTMIPPVADSVARPTTTAPTSAGPM